MALNHWRRGASAAIAAIALFLYQLIIYGGHLGFSYFMAITVDPLLSTPIPWILKAVVVFLLVISVILTFYTWVVLFWALTEDNINNRRIFHKDATQMILKTVIISFVGLMILILSILSILFVDVDEEQRNQFFIGWFMIFASYGIAFWELIALGTIQEDKVKLSAHGSNGYGRSRDEENAATETTTLLPATNPNAQHYKYICSSCSVVSSKAM